MNRQVDILKGKEFEKNRRANIKNSNGISIRYKFSINFFLHTLPWVLELKIHIYIIPRNNNKEKLKRERNKDRNQRIFQWKMFTILHYRHLTLHCTTRHVKEVSKSKENK